MGSALTMGSCYDACFTVPENTKHPSLSPAANPKTEAPSNEGVTNTKDANRQNMGHLTQKKDYSTAIAANKAQENNQNNGQGYQRNDAKDKPIDYANDAQTITTKSNGITVSEYDQNRRYVQDSAMDAEVLDDMLT